MKYVLFLLCALTAVSIGGCGGLASFPNVPGMPAQVAGGGIQGSNYGGHAPLVGAHIYLVQPGTGGYGSVVTGLLSAVTSGASFPVTDPSTGVLSYETFSSTANGSWSNSTYASDQFVPTVDAAGNPFYGVTTDSTGQFYITGDYTCTVGQPVILIGYGGSPSYSGAGPNTFSVATEEAYNDGSAGVYLTYTTTSTELLYVGETVTIAGNGSLANGFNETSTVLASGKHYNGSTAPLTTNSFSIYIPYNTGNIVGTATPSSAPGNVTGVTLTATPVAFNPAAVNMAVLGNCPSSGNFYSGSSALPYVYMNEVSTAAAAYALAPYLNWSANDQSGNDEFHIGTPNTTQALQGMANSAVSAGNLYDILGSGQTTVFAGEGHIARATTPSGTGIVPQALLDTVGNILAACVDSSNSYRLGTGTVSAQCKTLFQYAQDNGVYDTTATTHQAFNTAQAAFNIARYPQGAGTGTTTGQNASGYGGTQTVTAGTAASAAAFTSALYGLPTGNVPFSPNLTSTAVGVPNDFAVAINWQTASLNGGTNTGLSDVQVDANGNIWTVGTGLSNVYELSPAGVFTTYSPPPGSSVSNAFITGLAIDPSGVVYVPAGAGTLKFVSPATTGTLVTAANSNNASQIAVDSAGNLFFVNANTSNQQAAYLQRQTTAGVAAGGNFPVTGTCLYEAQYLALDASDNIWTNNQFEGSTPNFICRYNSAGVLQYQFAIPGTAFPLSYGIAIDNGGNAWFSEKDNSKLYKIAAGTTGTFSTGSYVTGGGNCSTAAGCTLATGATLSTPFGAAVDGANSIWVSNSGTANGSIVHFSNAAVGLTPTYLSGTGYGNNLLYVVVDISGNVWGVSYTGGNLVEFLGLASPTAQPLSYARANNKLGAQP